MTTARLTTPPCLRRGFTLAELIVASIILALVVGATTIAVFQVLRTRDRASSTGEAFARAQLAAAQMAADAQGALRDQDLLYCRIAVTRGGLAGKDAAGLLIFTHLNRPIRNDPEAPESDEYEVQYRLEPAIASAPNPRPTFTLWRRADAVPDDYPDGGGIAAPVADGIVSLSIDAYDGSAWLAQWDSDSDGYPHAIRITVVAGDDEGRRTSTARRMIAFDRTPSPLPAEEDDEATSTDTGGTAAR